MATDLQQLINDIRELPPDDKARLRAALDEEGDVTDASDREAEFQRRLVEKGLLKRIKPPVSDLEPYAEREPFEIEGEPLSETIIEERR